MLVLQNNVLRLAMNENGCGVVLEDLARRQAWRLDEATRFAAREPRTAADFVAGSAAMTAGDVCVLGAGEAKTAGQLRIESRHRCKAGEVTITWILEADRLRILATADGEAGVHWAALPGVFRPEGEPKFLSAIAHAQGVLYTGDGPVFHRALTGGGHETGCTMAMFGQFASGGGLLVISENEADAFCHWEKTAAGDVRLMWLQQPSFGVLGYEREVIVMPVAPDITSLCKRYRRYEAEHGRLVTWAEKIARRPVLEKLFGATTVFIGYHQDETLDYAAAFRRLKAMGVERAFVYPVYMASSIDLSAMGVKPIDIRRHMPLMKELDYAGGSFIYVTDGPIEEGPHGTDHLRMMQDGRPFMLWQINDLKWYIHSGARRLEWAKRFLDNEHAGLDGIHYDVLCSYRAGEDWHPLHRDGRAADIANRIEMLKLAGGYNKIVSSEGFYGRMTPWYDMGSTKYAHVLGGQEYCTVPMTMLVYHDCAIHTWWEIDNYNNFEHQAQSGRGQTWRFPWGGGGGANQAAIDALLGCPPDIFPFGLQYAFVPHNRPKIYTYRMSLDDPNVTRAIEMAKPVAALHKRIGKLEMMEHRMHRPDGAVQETVFADGTRVFANFANVALEAPGVGLLPPVTWREV